MMAIAFPYWKDWIRLEKDREFMHMKTQDLNERFLLSF